MTIVSRISSSKRDEPKLSWQGWKDYVERAIRQRQPKAIDDKALDNSK